MARAAAPVTGRNTRYGAQHPLRGATPVTGRCTRSEGVHCLRIGCSTPSHKNKRGSCETRTWVRYRSVATGPGHGVRDRQRGPKSDGKTTARQISHIISHGHFSRPPENVAIPTMQIQYLNKLPGNYVRNYCAGGPPPTGTSSSPAQRAARPTQTNNAAPEHPWGHTATQHHHNQHPQRNEAATGFPATASSRSIDATQQSGTASDQAVMSTWSSTAARPASRRATGTRNGEQDT